MKDHVLKYKIRRAERLKRRGYRADAEEEGEWRTTDNGHKILIKDGVVVGGSTFAIASMGAPNGKSMPKKSVELKKRHPFEGVRGKEREDLADALKGRKENGCIFGGFYKVEEDSTATLTTATFFNPYTGEYFGETVRDTDDDRRLYDGMMNQLYDIPINRSALWVWNRSNGTVQEGDTVRVVKGRTLEHGTEAMVREVREMSFSGKKVTYAYLDNGEKINVNNVDVVEDGKTLRSRESREADDIKEAHKEYRDKRKAEKIEKSITTDGVRAAVGTAKGRKGIGTALKKAGYNVEDLVEDKDSRDVDYRVMKSDGSGYVRVYKAYKTGEIKYQEWKKPEKETVEPDYAIEGAKRTARVFLKNYEKEKNRKFEDMDDGSKYAFVLTKTAAYFRNQGIDSKTAWSRAIRTAQGWAKKGFAGYGEDADGIGRTVIKGIIDELKK